MNNELNNRDKMIIRSSASLIEIIGGQPLDRFKINSQLPKKERINVISLLKMGPKEFYKASFTSIFQRCILYIPSIYFLNDFYNSNLLLNNNKDFILKPSFISLFITPQVSIFEAFKTHQQINIKNSNFSLKKIFPSFTATFLREASFSAGICTITPLLIKSEMFKNDFINDSITCGVVSGAITQFISHPFDTIKTNQEYNYKNNFIKTSKNIFIQDGINGFYRGLIPRCLRGMWTLGCLSYFTNEFTNLFKKY